ncbi:6-phospho-3-hexuloisomerase [Peribacillus cavernae]|uniref:6-phospho-3-hexuloisomerase n=1 Tax=Peribacillus cavernae TaxID=1674310 RepID=A0A433HJF8_9BACI|nr:6-phospho-3-hexuloisomerase [Peribacillus cavernae]MDQ0217779.1 6-phospho-3-hexuloisomerase [Peribacillus cavernae]RUQ28232.1 6-phospho-3-hexuloisomerase [Peribacillus cavernae]
MQTTQYLAEIMKELNRTIDAIADEEAEKLVSGILESKKIFVAGAGRSGFMAKSFVMRMVHMGLDAYVIGETVTPHFEKEDLLIIGSGSGETKSLVSIAEKAKVLEGTVAIATIFPQSTIGKLADFTIKLPGSPKDRSEDDYTTIQPMGSLFEQTLLLFYDAVILRFMEKKGLNSETMFGRHANLE